MSFCDELWRQQEIRKALRLRKLMVQAITNTDHEPDLRQILDLEFIDPNFVATCYPVSEN